MLRVSILSCALCMAGVSLAGEPPEEAEVVEMPAEQQGSHATPAQQLRASIEATRSLSGAFSQRSVDADGFVLEDSAGDFWFVAPDHFRWQYLEPFEQLIVADGERVWMYDTELEQVSVREQARDITQSPMALLGDPDQIERQFTVQRMESSEAFERLLLVPRDEQGDFDRVLVSLSDGVVTAITVRDAFGQVTELTLTGLEVNPSIDPDRFTFEPPDGVDVVGLDDTNP